MRIEKAVELKRLGKYFAGVSVTTDERDNPALLLQCTENFAKLVVEMKPVLKIVRQRQ